MPAASYRKFNAKLMAFALLIILIWAMLQQLASPDLISRAPTNATVVEEITHLKKERKISILILELDNGKTCKVFNNSKTDKKTGDIVSITLETYDDESQICVNPR